MPSDCLFEFDLFGWSCTQRHGDVNRFTVAHNRQDNCIARGFGRYEIAQQFIEICDRFAVERNDQVTAGVVADARGGAAGLYTSNVSRTILRYVNNVGASVCFQSQCLDLAQAHIAS